MKTILFLHGFFASGSCVPAKALKEAFADNLRVLCPDLPIHPKEALEFIHKICDKENPDLLIGNGCLSGTIWRTILLGKTRENVY